MIDLAPHHDHRWAEVPPCVWCEDCGVRLYQGALPADRAPANRATCKHKRDDGGERGMGFYLICLDCGAQGWYDWDEGHTREWVVWS